MARAEASIVINRALEEVVEYLDDPSSMLEWEAGALENEKTSEGPTAIGTTYRGVTAALGRRIEWTSEVVELEPYKRVKQKVLFGPVELYQTWIFEGDEGGTRLTFIGEGEPRGFFRLADPLVVRIYQRTLEGNLANLKEILEA